MRRRLFALSLSLVIAGAVHADEGMWMPSQLPDIAPQLRAAGFKGQARDLAELAKPPMNAVVKVGGASGAFVSRDGVVLTNHHVAFGVVQYNSRPGRDLIKDGYVAADRAGELPANPDYRVLVTTGFDRITDRILADAKGKQGRAYYDAIDGASKAAVSQCEREPGYRCSVANMYYGTDFYLVRQLELRDVRLVYAPPNDIGNFGGEVDNFVWPRHAGDFTLLRAYVGKDGKPADHSADNVPYVPPAHLQVSTRNVKEGDFAMLAGYPGVTFRHRMASEFGNQIDWQLPSRVAVYQRMIDVIEGTAAKDETARVAYASQVRSLKNSLKRAQGELDGLRRSDAARVRREDEAAMFAWLDRQHDAAPTRADIAAAQAVLDKGIATRERDQLLGLIQSETQLLRAALTVQRLAHERTKPDAQREAGFQQRDEVLDHRPAQAGPAALRIAGGKSTAQRTADAVPGAAGRAARGGVRRRVRHHAGAVEADAGRDVRRHEARRRGAAAGRDAGSHAGRRQRRARRLRRHAAEGRRDAAARRAAPGRREQDQRRRTAAPASGVHARTDRLPQVAGSARCIRTPTPRCASATAASARWIRATACTTGR